jgi:riboflavin kinase/FMN adenylyltransferase
VGGAPTFDDHARRIEVHMPDLDDLDPRPRTLHGHVLRVRFFDRLRDPQRFDSPAALRHQLAIDVADARRVFNEVRAKGCTDNGCPSSGDQEPSCSESST